MRQSHVVGVLGAGLHEFDAQRVRQLFRLVVGHDLLGGQVALVAHQELSHPLGGVLVDLLDPVLHVVEGLLVGDVVDHDDAVGAPVVGAGDGAEPLLASRVPDLQLRGPGVLFQSAELKVHPNGADVALRVGVIRESEQKATLAHPRVTDEQELEEVVILRVRHEKARERRGPNKWPAVNSRALDLEPAKMATATPFIGIPIVVV